MKKLTFVMALGVTGIALLMTSCGGGSEPSAQKPAAPVQKEEVKPAANNNDMAAQMARGEQIYKAKCCKNKKINEDNRLEQIVFYQYQVENPNW